MFKLTTTATLVTTLLLSGCDASRMRDQPATVHPFSQGSMFELYRDNERQAIPNYITTDFLLLSYSMVREATLAGLEEKELIPLQQNLFAQLEQAWLEVPASADQQQSLAYVRLLRVLAQPELADSLPLSDVARQELALIMEAGQQTQSPLWGQPFDYSALKPRGRYSATRALEAYFRASAYGAAVLFPINASPATGISESLADTRTRQALEFALLIQNTPVLTAAYQRYSNALNWQAGNSDDLSWQELIDVYNQGGRAHYRKRLQQYTNTEQRQPRILSGIVDPARLKPGQTSASVLTGWRLLPARFSADSAALQQLVFNSTGDYQPQRDDCPEPAGLSHAQGRAVKGIPLVDELLTLLGSAQLAVQLDAHCERDFAGYSDAATRAGQLLSDAEGATGHQLQLMRKTLKAEAEAIDSQQLHTRLRAFWTWQRYLGVLYQKQSSTPTSKSMAVVPQISHGWIEPDSTLYQALAELTVAHQQQTPDWRWDRFAQLLDGTLAISEKLRNDTPLTEQDIVFINKLDNRLFALTGQPDRPIVVDIHTDRSSNQVQQQGVGYAAAVERPLAEGVTGRGARFTHYEFRQPLTERLTDQRWQQQLDRQLATIEGERQ